MKRTLITFTAISSLFFQSHVLSQSQGMPSSLPMGGISTHGHSTLDTGDHWWIGKTIENVETKRGRMITDVAYGFFVDPSPFLAGTGVAYDVIFLTPYYRNQSCVANAATGSNLVKIVTDSGTIASSFGSDQNFSPIDMTHNNFSASYDHFTFALSFPETRELAQSNEVAFEICQDRYVLSNQAMNKLRELVKAAEEAALRYDYDLDQVPNSSYSDQMDNPQPTLQNITIPDINF